MKTQVQRFIYPLIIISFTVSASIFYWKSLLVNQQVEMGTAQHRSELHVQQINEAVDQQLDATIRSLDTILKHLRPDYLHNRKDFDRIVLDALGSYPKEMLQNVIVIGADGYVSYSSNSKPNHIFAGDREHFRVHAESNQDQLFISKPILGRIDGSWLIEFTRPIWDGKRFVGVIGIPVRPEYISNRLWSLHIDPNDMISIVREDGRIIARSRKLKEGLQLTVPLDRPFMHSHPGEHGIFRSVSITDQVPMLFSWRHLANYPIIAVAAIDETVELTGVIEQQSKVRIRTLQAIALIVAFALWVSLLFIRGNRKNHELALSEGNLIKSESRFRSIMEHAPIGMLTTAPDGHILLANQAFCDIVGYSEDELEKLSYQDLTHPEDKTLTLEDRQKLLDGKIDSYQMDKRYIHRNGQIRWVRVTSSSVSKDSNEQPYFVAQIEDITERKFARELLLKQKQFSDDVINNLPGIFYIINQQTKFVRVNPQFAKVSGYTNEQLIDMSVLDLFEGEHRQLIAEKMQEVFDKGEASAEAELLTKSGQRIPYAFSGHKTEIDDQTYLIGLGTDISERKATEALLHDSDEKIRGIFESTLDGILLVDAKTMQHATCNPAFANMLGYSIDEITKLGVPDTHYQKDLPYVFEQFEKVRRGEISVAKDIPMKRKDGSVFFADIKNAHLNLGGIDYILANFRDITERKEAEEAIQELAFFDPLTSLSNRRLLQDRLFQALSSSDRNGKIGALLFIDLDNFKSINDAFGHAKGDQLLQQVAERLKSCVRIGDTVARLGGDEFVVMLENLNDQAIHAATEAEVIGQKILTTLNQPYRLGSRELVNTPSIGISLFNGHQQLADDLFKQADIAMYQAKNEGRNTLRFFDPKVQLAINHRVTLEGELRSAIEYHQFFLHYQIQVDQANRPVGAEALIRWIHPTRNMVSPAEFIPIAEETGMILPIGKWVLDTACAQLSLWQLDEKSRDLMLSVNVSGKQFVQADFAAQVKEIVQRHGINPAKLKLELTESILLDNIERIISTMNEIGAIGIRFSLDDFGTGYSSLQYLKKLPLSQLKIDQSFVRDLVVDSNDRAIVDTIIGISRSLELDVIAEGVETEEQKQILEAAGCCHFQGYLFGKPMPINQLRELIK